MELLESLKEQKPETAEKLVKMMEEVSNVLLEGFSGKEQHFFVETLRSNLESAHQRKIETRKEELNHSLQELDDLKGNPPQEALKDG